MDWLRCRIYSYLIESNQPERYRNGKEDRFVLSSHRNTT
nr:MAG TPA: hypothetical protein [Caudoviricetes sp.]